jgi:hypothetical protein
LYNKKKRNTISATDNTLFGKKWKNIMKEVIGYLLAMVVKEEF